MNHHYKQKPFSAIQAALRIATAATEKFTVAKSYKIRRRAGKIGDLGKLSLLCNISDFTLNAGGRDVPVRDFVPAKIRESFMFEMSGDLRCFDGSGYVILFFHGGGWVLGNVSAYTPLCADIAVKTGMRVISVDYRLAPEHKFPEGFNDCFAVCSYFYENAERLLSVPPENIILMGDSAGGNLAAAVSLKARDTGAFTVARQILFYPAAFNDHTENSKYKSVTENGYDYVLTSARIEEFMQLYQNSPRDKESPYFAPLLSESFAGQPDTLVFTAELDPLRDEGEDYGNRLMRAGSRVTICRLKNGLHNFLRLPGAPFNKRCYEIISNFILLTGEKEK